jgi:GNAT superfamily N-acetyltransferase
VREQLRVGIDHLGAVTELLQRVRSAHPTSGVYEAAEMHWWWTVARATDGSAQLYWYDDDGRPAAAVLVTDFGDGSSAVYDDPIIVVIALPNASPDWVAHVVERGLAHVRDLGVGVVGIEVARDDDVLRSVLQEQGFTLTGEGVVQCWLATSALPEISDLPAGYRLLDRRDTVGHLHHMVGRNRPDIAHRLGQSSLYRPDLDLLVVCADPAETETGTADDVAAYGMFWFDPVTATGVVEPMRTLDDHQRRGLARHVLTAGVHRLAAAGATRISIAFEPDNASARHLYLGVGFEPHRRTDTYSRALA